MIAYVIRRLGWVVVALLGIIVVNFVIIHALPVNFAKVIAGQHASAVTLQEITRTYGFDKPLPTQFWIYFQSLASGNLGYSYQLHLSVNQMVAQAAPKTLYLAVVAVILELLIGVPVGLWTARRAGSWVDSIVTTIAVVGISLPTFAVGSGLLYLFAYQLGWFPLNGYAPFPNLQYVFLPALSYAITGAAFYARLLRQSVLEVTRLDHVRTARAKGLSEPRVLIRHVLRNALIPLVTYFGLDFGGLLGGLIITENIFGWPGLGLMTFRAISELDVPTIMGTVIFAAGCIVVMNLVVDVSYAFLDPRISYS
jgi:peptide/nickel transport system permease protein